MGIKNKSNIIPFRRDAKFYFRLSVKYADRHMYSVAYKYLSKAVEMEPGNPDYQFNLAGILAELKDYRKSNSILKNIIENIDPSLTECYFGMGCNYFDMGNIKLAIKYFKKYLASDPMGYFYEEAENALYYLKIYEEEMKELSDKSNKEVYDTGEIDGFEQGYDADGDRVSSNKKGKNAKSALKREVKWEKEWEKIIECALLKKEPGYKSNYRQELKDIWIGFIGTLKKQDVIIEGKAEIWAAALEYIYCKRNSIKTTKAWLASKYNISPASITRKLKHMNYDNFA